MSPGIHPWYKLYIAFWCHDVQALEDQGEDMEAAAAAAVASSAASEDLHANLEGQLRASRADVGRLQSEVKRLQAAATAASRVTDAVTSPLGRDTSFLEEDRWLKSQLEASETRCNLLQKEVTQLKAAAVPSAVAASNQAAVVEPASPVSRDGSQTASSSGRTAGMGGTLPNGILQGFSTKLLCFPSSCTLQVTCLLSTWQAKAKDVFPMVLHVLFVFVCGVSLVPVTNLSLHFSK